MGPRRSAPAFYDHAYLLSPTAITNASSLYRGYRYGARSIARSQELLQRKTAKVTSSPSITIPNLSVTQKINGVVKKLEGYDLQRLFLITTLVVVIAVSIPSYLEPLTKPTPW